MKYLAYILTAALLRLLSLLPRPLLYLHANLLGFVLHRIVGYRRNVVSKNLRNVFPGYSEKQISETRKRFYRNLADVIVENAVIQFYPRRKLEKMFSFKNPELLHQYYKQGRHVVLITGHYNNWEWASPLSYTFQHLVIGVYRPLKNRHFDRAFRTARTRFGADMVPMGRIGRALIEYRENETLTLTGMVGDQRPVRKYVQYWTEFMNQKTAVFTGSEKLAIKMNAVVVFMKVRRLHRGTYEAEIETITESPKETGKFEITEKHTRILEQLILEDPACWLWSHNRWKISYERWKELEGKD